MGVKLGQKWAVKDGNLLASNRVGSRFFNKEFDFSRASNGTYVDRDGLLKTAELYNLIPYSEDFTQWQKLNSAVTSNLITSPSGVKNADLINYSITSSNGYIRLAHSAAQYITIYAKYKDIQWLMCYGSGLGAGKFVDIQNGVIGGNVGSGANAEIYDVGNGWKRIHFYSSSANITQFSIYAAESDGSYASISLNGGVYLWGAQAVEGTEPRDYQYTNGRVGIPRIDFSDGVGALLLEPQRSNLLLQSNQFDTTWTLSNDATLGSRVADPFRGTDAWEINFATTSGSRIQQAVSVVDGSSYVFSIYAKVPSGTQDLQIYSTISGTPETITLTDQWQRFEVFRTNVGYTQAFPQIRNNSGTEFTAYIYAAQYEQGSYPTSIIETTTTQITRLADVCNNSGSAQDFNSEEGVLYAEIAALADDGTNRVISLFKDTNDRIQMYFDVTTNILSIFYKAQGTTTFGMSELLSDVTQLNKIAFKWKTNDFALWVNGTETDTLSSGVTPNKNTLDTLSFKMFNDSSPFYGKVRNLQVFTEALSDAELQQLTT